MKKQDIFKHIGLLIFSFVSILMLRSSYGFNSHFYNFILEIIVHLLFVIIAVITFAYLLKISFKKIWFEIVLLALVTLFFIPTNDTPNIDLFHEKEHDFKQFQTLPKFKGTWAYSSIIKNSKSIVFPIIGADYSRMIEITNHRPILLDDFEQIDYDQQILIHDINVSYCENEDEIYATYLYQGYQVYVYLNNMEIENTVLS